MAKYGASEQNCMMQGSKELSQVIVVKKGIVEHVWSIPKVPVKCIGVLAMIVASRPVEVNSARLDRANPLAVRKTVSHVLVLLGFASETVEKTGEKRQQGQDLHSIPTSGVNVPSGSTTVSFIYLW